MSAGPQDTDPPPPPLTGKEAAALDKLVQRHLGGGPPEAQAERLAQRLAQVDAPVEQYEQWALCGSRVYQRLGELARPGSGGAEVRAALLCIYLGQWARARALLPSGFAVERAYLRLWESKAQAAPAAAASPGEAADRAAPLYVQAGQELALAKRPVQAALAYQAAGRLDAAQACWQTVLADSRLQPYHQALVRVNLSLALHRGQSSRLAHRQAAAAQQLLEEVADEAEARGERERALDCYRVLLQLGQALGRFENLAEGYLNCIRILKDEQLRLHALRYYEDFARVGSEHGEHHTVAQVCREAADYLDRRGLDPALRRRYQRRAATAAVAAAAQLQARGGAVTLCEHAYLLAIESWNALDDFVEVGACFAALAALPLPTERQQRYLRLVEDYPRPPVPASPGTPGAPGATADAGAALPAFLRQQQAYPPVWLLDLLEWEAAGDPAAVCLSLLGDTQRAVVTRRHALLVLLLCHAAAAPGPGADPAPPQAGEARRQHALAIVSSLSNLRAYEALRPLERLYAESAARAGSPAEAAHAAEVRTAILAAPPKLLYKRAFYLVARGLDDPHPAARRQALESLARLHFPDAIAPLCRLFRDSRDPAVRSAILHSLGRAHDLRAGEFLLEVLRHEPEPLRGEAHRLLLRYENQELVPLVQRSLELDSGAARPLLQAVLAHLTGEPAPPAY